MGTSTYYRQYIRPLLFNLDSEQAHLLAHQSAVLASPIWSSLSSIFRYKGTDLRTTIAGAQLDNPVGLAAGFDKNAHLISILGNFGFGFAEIGSITAKASAGNPRPRLFRLIDDEALINRMGLNGDGADVIANRLSHTRANLPIGLNIAKTNDPTIAGDKAVEDILYSFNTIKDLPATYVTINASCPNTKEGILEEKKQLSTILSEIQKLNTRSLPIFVKLSPDSSDALLADMVEAAVENNIAGYVLGNTSTSRNNLKSDSSLVTSCGNGGLSGKPIKSLGLDLCKRVYRLKQASQSIIGVGGIFSGKDAFDYIAAGANAIEVYTGLIYEGPTLPREICEQLSQILSSHKMTLTQAIGSNN